MEDFIAKYYRSKFYFLSLNSIIGNLTSNLDAFPQVLDVAWSVLSWHSWEQAALGGNTIREGAGLGPFLW